VSPFPTTNAIAQRGNSGNTSEADDAKIPLEHNHVIETIEENPTDYGPADYVLVSDGRIQGVVEAKKLSLGPQNVLLQAERYSRGVSDSPFNFDGIHVPFLYATNGEVLWFHDIRHGLNRSRQISIFSRHQHWKRR
jgi:type I site-specific restriction endonuclease